MDYIANKFKIRLKRAEMHLKETLNITDREVGDEFKIASSTFNLWKKKSKKASLRDFNQSLYYSTPQSRKRSRLIGN